MSMLDLSEYPEAFATPAGCQGKPLAGLLASAYLDAIHSQVRTELERTADASACRLNVTDGATPQAGNAWRPECGLVLAALKRGQTVCAATQMVLALAATGRQVMFEAVVERPTRLFIDGYLFEVCGRMRIATEHDAIVVTSDGARVTLRFSFNTGKWRATSESIESEAMIFAPLDLPECAHAPTYAIAAPSNTLEHNDLWSMCESCSATDEAASGGTRACSSDLPGLAFVETFAPSYAIWNRPVSCGVLLQRPAANGTAGSSSSSSRPGLIYLSGGASAALQGELFVHENAHQHLILYEHFVSLTYKGDTCEYYSPIKGRHRNAQRTLLAVHAIGNMLLYYCEAFRNAAELTRDMPRIQRYLGWFNQMSKDLTGSPALTVTGRRLLSSLVSAVEAADVLRAI